MYGFIFSYIIFTCICIGVSCSLALSFSSVSLSCKASSFCSLFSISACESKWKTVNHIHHHLPKTEPFFMLLHMRMTSSDLKCNKMGLCFLLFAQAGDVTHLRDRGGCPLVDVFFHGFEVIPKDNTVTQSLCVGLYFL